jgi:hypothetical protein
MAASTTTTTTPKINREALDAFITRQVEKITTTPVPPELAGLADSEKLSGDEVLALWYGAGLASQIGMVLAMDPGTFVDGFPEQDDDADAEHDAADALNEPGDPAPAA